MILNGKPMPRAFLCSIDYSWLICSSKADGCRFRGRLLWALKVDRLHQPSVASVVLPPLSNCDLGKLLKALATNALEDSMPVNRSVGLGDFRACCLPSVLYPKSVETGQRRGLLTLPEHSCV